VNNVSVGGPPIFDQIINTTSKGAPLVFEEGSTFVAKFAVAFDVSACNGEPVAGSGVNTVGTIEYVATPQITEAGPDFGDTDTETKQITVTCKPAR
jgi:hypothetical protein